MQRKAPAWVKCEGCGRRLDIETYSTWINDDIPEEEITRVFDPMHPYVAVQCPNCGHFTIHTPFER